jgi:hypothetical protein
LIDKLNARLLLKDKETASKQEYLVKELAKTEKKYENLMKLREQHTANINEVFDRQAECSTIVKTQRDRQPTEKTRISCQ